MNKSVLALLMFVSTFALGQDATASASAGLSSAAQSLAEARKNIAENPTLYSAYNRLAMALLRRARETSEASYYAQAAEAVEKSLQLAPNNFDAQKIKVSILLSQHEYPAALQAAKTLNRRVPDDVMVYGLLTDANVELGNYSDAEKSAQWMLNLRPGNLPALTRAAHLRELFGDAEGAYELFDLAYQSTPSTDSDERAWILTQMGHLRFASGNLAAAEKLLQQALTTLPGHLSATGNLAQVRIAQKRYQEAIFLLQQRNQSALRPAANLYELAEALQSAGHFDDANKVFGEFEAKALQESDNKDNSNCALVFYYADHARQPGKALKVAEQEYAWHHDLYTLDAYAWALHVNGRDIEARKQIEVALAVGIRDAKLFRHAGVIALKTGDRTSAELYLKQSSDLDSADSEQARNILVGLASKPEHK